MINLNDKEYTESPYATRDDLLKHYNEYEYLRNYIGDFELGRSICSPLREDNKG